MPAAFIAVSSWNRLSERNRKIVATSMTTGSPSWSAAARGDGAGGGVALAGGGHEQREPDDRERDVRCPDGDPGGDALAQGGPLQRRQEHVVRDEDHQAPGERDGPAAAM